MANLSGGLANLSRSLRVDAMADPSTTSMNSYALGPSMTQQQQSAMNAMKLGGGESAATLGYDLSRLLSSKIISGDGSLTLQGGGSGAGWGDSSSLAYPAPMTAGHGGAGLTNSFAFGGEASNAETSHIELLLNHQKNLMLEEQIRRNLLNESLLSSQAAARGFAPPSFGRSFGGLGGAQPPVRRDSNVLHGEGQSSIDRLNELLASYANQIPAVAPHDRCVNTVESAFGRILSCPPTVKKPRRDDSKIAELLERIVKRHKTTSTAKHRFPSPSAKRNRKIRVHDLAVLRERWRTVSERTTTAATRCTTTQPGLKEAFDKELFARSLFRSDSRSLEGRLKEVA